MYNAPLKSRLSDHSLLSRRLHHSNTGMATPTRRIHPSSSSSHAIRSLCCCPPQNRLVSPARHTTRHNHSCITTNRVALSSCQIPLAPCVCLSRPLHNRKQRDTSRRRLLSAPNLMLSHCSSAPTARRASCSGGSGTSGGCGRPNCLSSLSRRSGMGAPAAVGRGREGEGKV